MAVPTFKLHSPLDSLVRRTSARKPELQPHFLQETPLRQRLEQPPISPLLHSHFQRNSTATASSNDNDSYLAEDPYHDPDLDYRYYDDESIYSTNIAPALRESWLSTDSSPQMSSVEGAVTSPQIYTDLSTQPLSMTTTIPTAVTTNPPDDTRVEAHTPRASRAPIVKPITSNFSRPVRPPIVTNPESEEQKRRVLERNSKRDTSLNQQPMRQASPGVSFSGVGKQSTNSPLRFEATRSPSPAMGPLYSQPSEEIPLDPSAFSTQPRAAPLPPALPSQLSPTHKSSTQRTPEEYLQLGIQHHEANRLKESAACFEKSATENGGCGVGMLMWGLALRHGWGCEKNEKYGFRWLRHAAESAVEGLENARTSGSMEMGAVQTELVLAIYEVGQCFFQGWGVVKDQKMAVSYYTVAARLGDVDAQTDLGFCLANGKGCKKNRKEAAKWYRAAVAQGQSDIGLGWIYKEKYQ